MTESKRQRRATASTGPDTNTNTDTDAIIATDEDYESLVRIDAASRAAVAKALRQMQQEVTRPHPASRRTDTRYPSRNPR